MSALANVNATNLLDIDAGSILVTTSATVGKNLTFEPEGQVALGVQRYVERSSGIPVAYPSYTISVRRPQNGSRNYRVQEKVTLPVLNISSPATGSGVQPLPSVAYNLICNREWILPEASTEAERKLLINLVASFSSRVINASDYSPTDATGAPMFDAVIKSIGPY